MPDGFYLGDTWVEVPRGYEYSSPDLSNLGNYTPIRRPASLGELGAANPVVEVPRPAPAVQPAPATATAPNPVNRPVNAPARPTVPTSSPGGGNLMGLLNNAAGAYAGIRAAGMAEQALADGIERFGDRNIPASIRPLYDGIYDAADRARGQFLPAPVAGLADAARGLQGMRPISPIGALAAPISCSLFGQGCTDRTPEGIPFAGDDTPPFYGGQQPGVAYSVRVQWETFNMSNDAPFSSGDTNWQSGTTGFRIWGAISNIYTPKKEDVLSRANSIFVVQAASATDQTRVERTILSSSDTLRYRVIRGIQIQRLDLQPDTGGNPRPLPGTPVTPSRSPVVQNPREITPGQPQSRPANHPQTVPGTASPQPIAAPAPQPALQPLTGIPGNSPVAPPVTNPPPPQSEPEGSPTSAPGGNQPWWFIPALVAAPVIASPLSRLNGGQARPGGTRIGTGTTPTSLNCSYDSQGISGKVDNTNNLLNTIQQVQLAQMQSMLAKIDNKLGDQVEGGLSGYLKKFWQWFYIDRIMNLITMWTTIHNAYMLSNGIAQSLFGVFDIVFQIFNFSLKDDEGNDIDTGSWIGEQFDTFFKQIFGDDNVDEVRRQWNRWNRIYQAAANILNAVQSIMYSIAEGMEVIGNYVAKIGNAAKKYGVFVERCYSWMNPTLNFRKNKFFKRLEQIQEFVEAGEVVASEVLNITEMVQEIDRQKTELRDLITDKEREIEREHSLGVRESVPPLAPRITESDEAPPSGVE
jgi:hypothetical protein